LNTHAEVGGHVKGSGHVDRENTLRLFEELAVVEPVADYLFLLASIEPLDAFAFFPEAKLGSLVGDGVLTESVLFSLAPVARVHAPIRPRVNAKAVLLIVFVLAFVASAVLPGVHTHSVHVVVDPLALVLSAVQPRIRSQTF